MSGILGGSVYGHKRGGVGAKGAEKRPMILFLSRSPLLIEMLHQPTSIHFSTLLGSDTQNAMAREAHLLTQAGHRTKGWQRESPFCCTLTPTTPVQLCQQYVPFYRPLCHLSSPKEGRVLTSADGRRCSGVTPTIWHFRPSLILFLPPGRKCPESRTSKLPFPNVKMTCLPHH